MICDRVQAEVSRTMDESHVLSPQSARHVSICSECAEFEETATDVARRYRVQVRAGIDRLRRLEAPRRFPKRATAGWLVPLAAALLLCWWGAEPIAPKVLVQAAPAVTSAPPLRIWPVDEEDLSFISVRDFLPVRLDDEFWPSEPEIVLPRSLRF